MTSEERKRAIADAKALAEEMAARFIRRGTRRNSTEAERLRAETAAIILDIASKRASTVPADECAKWVQSLWQLGEQHEAKIAAATKMEIAKGNHDFSTGPVREAIDATLALLEQRIEAFNAWTDNHRLAAWLAACDDFSTWDRPLGALMAQAEGGHGAN